MRLRCLLLIALLALLPASNAAAGGVPPTEAGAGPEGVVGPGGAFRFGALATGKGTVVSKARVGDGRVMRAAVLQGRWTVPVVANDYTTGGLSADGSTLVLARAFTSFPVRSTTFAVLDAGRLATRRTIELKGKWSFDALSPHASTVYLIQTTHPKTSRYAVRAYDLRTGRLLPDPIVDPSEPDEPMRGSPMTRATSRGGRWVYTLYAGGDHPFIHALDTVRRTSLCLDLPQRAARHAWSSRLAIRGATIQVRYRDRVIASASRRPQEASTGGGPPWAVALLLVSGLIAAAGMRRVVVANRPG